MTVIRTRKGVKISWAGEPMTVIGQKGFDSVLVKNKTGEIFEAPLTDLQQQVTQSAPTIEPADPIREGKVPAYVAAFKPYLDLAVRTKADIKKVAAELSISVASAYVAMKRYVESGQDLNKLPPPTRPGGRGKSRLKSELDRIITETIEDILLTRRNHTFRFFKQKIESVLDKHGLKVSEGTLRARVAAVPGYKWMRRRSGHTEAETRLAPRKDLPGPLAEKPLDLIECDHWEGDCLILGDDRLQSAGRVWITIAQDIYTHAVWGLYFGIHSPNTTSIAFCAMNGILRKESFLKDYGLSFDYPIYGSPKIFYTDNGKDFTSTSLEASFKHFNILQRFRPPRQPRFGGHIESFNKHLSLVFKDIPGATGSNPEEKKKFRPEKTAAFTFDDLVKFVLIEVEKYHETSHLSLGGRTPKQAWHDYYFGPEGQRHPTPDVIVNDRNFRLHWYKLEPRSFQSYGIQIDHLQYYGENIEYLVRNRKDGEKVLIRRNPLDVREIYVQHPTTHEWLVVPIRQIGFPGMTALELRDVKRQALKEKRKPTPENLRRIFEQSQAHIEKAKSLTKSASRKAALRSSTKRLRAAIERPLPPTPKPPNPAPPGTDDIILLDEPTQHEEQTPRKKNPSKATIPVAPIPVAPIPIAPQLNFITDQILDEMLDDDGI